MGFLFPSCPVPHFSNRGIPHNITDQTDGQHEEICPSAGSGRARARGSCDLHWLRQEDAPVVRSHVHAQIHAHIYIYISISQSIYLFIYLPARRLKQHAFGCHRRRRLLRFFLAMASLNSKSRLRHPMTEEPIKAHSGVPRGPPNMDSKIVGTCNRTPNL